jgi:hypothetical protein
MSIPNIGAILSSGVQIGGDATETAVAHAWLTKHVDDYDRIELNVPLGPGLQLGPGYEPWVQKAATANSRARADLIAYRGAAATIVEFKGNITPAALGQLLTYWKLMTADNPALLQVYKVVAGQTVQLGLPAIFDQYGVSVELFPGAAPPTTTES